MSKRIVLLVLAPLLLLAGAGISSAGAPVTAGNTVTASSRICIGVTSDPSSNGRDGICVRNPAY